jgi:hypothetical protein
MCSVGIGAMESGAPFEMLMDQIDVPLEISADQAEVQMVPSGPGYEGHAIIQNHENDT